ncbi:MAG TPA: PepSY-like domain-containing protein [Chitinophagaceae bacterium]|nr:PepSY-like domain-containing protein [Chitinophagaceae bacterium]
MKRMFIVLITAIIAVSSAHSQIKVTDAAKKAFAAKFPNATNVKWGKENASEYEAEFKLNGQPVSANFKLDGSWVETESSIAVSDLPPAVTNAIKAKYPGTILNKAEKVEMPGGKTVYETVVKVNGKKKEIEINPDGTFVK